MSAVMNSSEVVETVRAAQRPMGPAIESKPLVGSEVTIKLALTPGTVTLIAAPVTVIVTMVAGWVLLTSLGSPVYVREMIGAGIVNALGGMLASVPLFLLMRKGAQAIAQAGILAIAVRCGAILMGMILAMSPAWGMNKMPLVYWMMGCYFPMLMVETAVVAWLANKARH
jgi:hypothetical protein